MTNQHPRGTNSPHKKRTGRPVTNEAALVHRRRRSGRRRPLGGAHCTTQVNSSTLRLPPAPPFQISNPKKTSVRYMLEPMP